jgi:hypothetical protein
MIELEEVAKLVHNDVILHGFGEEEHPHIEAQVPFSGTAPPTSFLISHRDCAVRDAAQGAVFFRRSEPRDFFSDDGKRAIFVAHVIGGTEKVEARDGYATIIFIGARGGTPCDIINFANKPFRMVTDEAFGTSINRGARHPSHASRNG